MQKFLSIFAVTLLFCQVALTEEPKQEEQDEVDQPDTAQADEPPAEPGTKTMSGMSILGNEEAPKSLVIIPWKSSEIGSDLSLSDTLGDRARPVDKEVFLRELNFYRIRAGE